MSPHFLLACDTLPTNPWERDRLPAIRKALEYWKYSIIDIFEFNSHEEAHFIHRTKAHYSFFSNGNLQDLNEKLYRKISSHPCDILVLGTLDCYSWFLSPDTVEKLRRDGVFVVGILGDDEYMYKRNRLYIPMFNRTVGYVKWCVDYYNSIVPNSCYYLPNSCFFPERDFEKLQIDESEKEHDVVLLGAAFGKRPQMIRALAQAGIKVSLFGNPQWKEFDHLSPCYHGYLHSDEISPMIRKSKIVLALLEDHLTGVLHMNTKIWEAVKMGQMCITALYPPLIEDYGLSENEDIVMYHSTSDLVDKVTYYLANPAERKRIAANLFHKTKISFDYENMYRRLFRTMETDYLNAKHNGGTKESYRDDLITIIDYSSSPSSHRGFKMVRPPLTEEWATSLRDNYEKWIQTPYVILTYGGVSYSPYLNRIVEVFPHEFFDGKAAFLSDHSSYDDRENHFADIRTIVWRKEAFFDQFLKGQHPVSSPNSSCEIPRYSYANIRLCRPNLKDQHGGLSL